MRAPSPGPLARSSLLLVSACLLACKPEPASEQPDAAAPVAVDPAEAELEARLAYLEQRIEQARIEGHVPGMAAAVVRGDELIWAEGFGVADLDTNTPVTPETVFAIGSSTKAFSSTLVAMMVDEGKLGWDDPASKHLPGFELKVDGEGPATIRDLLSHRSGFARMGLLWAGNTISREEILRYASQAEPVAPFRKEFHYNNVTYMAGALAAARAAGTSWEELLRTRLLEPLHMDHSSFDHATTAADPARAKGYTWREDLGKLEAATLRNTDAIGPAGSIFSSVLDMSNWLRFQLGEGELEGKRLVSAEALGETRKPQIEVAPDIDYGMGWMLRSWEGRQVVEHGGNIDGYAASVALMPEEGLGVVVLTNVALTPVQGQAMNLVWDAMLTDAYLPRDAAAGEDFSRFVGAYVAELPGFAGQSFEVLIEDGKLAVDVPGQTTYLLAPPDEDGWRSFEATDTVAVSFDENEKREVIALRLHQNGMSYELLREGVELPTEVSEADVRPYLGNYETESGMSAEVLIHRGRLAVDVHGQMTYDLEPPEKDGKYHFRINYDFVVSFNEGEGKHADEIVGMTIIQPGAANVFTRVPAPKTVDLDQLHRRRKTDKRAKALAKAGVVHLRRRVEHVNSGVEGTGELWFDDQGRLREEVEFGPVGAGLSIVHEHGGWAESSFEPRKALEGIELRQVQLDHPRVIYGDWRAHYQETLLRTETGERGEVHVIELRADDLPPRTIHVDAKTGDVLEIHAVEVGANGLRVPTVTELSDYRTVAGMRLPFRAEVRNPHTGKMVVTIVEAETKVAPDPARFAPMPAP